MQKPTNKKSDKQSKLSEEFQSKLAEICAGYLPSFIFDKLIEIIQNEIGIHFFTRSSESNFLRIVTSMFDKYSFLNDCIKYPHYIEVLTTISSNSNYLTDILVRSPEYFYWIVNPSNLGPKLNHLDFEKNVDYALSYYKSFSSKVNFFRSLKRKEILRIGLKDILGLAALEETTEELSILAKVITAKLFELSVEEIKSKYSIDDLKADYCLVGLGKLGGNELNYSSDIDLIVFYDEDHTIKNKTTFELLTEATKLFIESSSSITSAGFIYRVDFRLRPDGRNSPLCRSLNEYLSYYESRGEDWERQMLIKASFIGGSLELYNKFINYLTAFIYPASFSNSPTEQIKKFKKNIERNLGEEENIKLLPGGIRDIEFSVQALQLINGGKWKELRTGNTLKAISLLHDKKLLSDKEAQQLSDAYIFFRKIEHYLQLMNDKQTHTIPTDFEMLNKLSCYLKFNNTKEFKNALENFRVSVLKIYNSIMGKDIKVIKREDISVIHFENKKKALQDFTFLREGKGLLGQKEFDERTISLFQNFESFLIEYLKKSFNPDSTLQNFVRIIRHSAFPNIWYKELNDKKFLNSLLTICEYAQKAVDLFAEDDELKECFLDRSAFNKLVPEIYLGYSLKKLNFVLIIQYTLGILKHEKLSEIISNYCKEKIRLTADDALGGKHNSKKYFIAALGSCGTNEMTFNSDIDLIFVVDDSKSIHNAEKNFQNVLQKIRNTLLPVEVDCRLRPEGKSSNLAWSIKSYDDYIQKRLRIWELQAFTKISFVCGDINLYNTFLKSLLKRLTGEDSENIKSEIAAMRKKIYSHSISSGINMINLKKSPGGITDIEFTIQLLILSSAKIFLELIGKPIKSTLEILKQNFPSEELEILKTNYDFLKKLNLFNQIIFNSSTAMLPSDKKKVSMLSHQIGFKNSDEFQSHLNNIMKSNKNIFQKFVVKN